MAVQRKSRGFKDISLSFLPHPVTKDLPVLTNERAISRSVRNLVETIPTERFFNPDLGTDIRNSLFENFSRTTVTIIEDQVKETIRNFEPRIGELQVQVEGRPDDNALDISVAFTIIGLDIPFQTFTCILEPTREYAFYTVY